MEVAVATETTNLYLLAIFGLAAIDLGLIAMLWKLRTSVVRLDNSMGESVKLHMEEAARVSENMIRLIAAIEGNKDSLQALKADFDTIISAFRDGQTRMAKVMDGFGSVLEGLGFVDTKKDAMAAK